MCYTFCIFIQGVMFCTDNNCRNVDCMFQYHFNTLEYVQCVMMGLTYHFIRDVRMLKPKILNCQLQNV